MIRCGSRGINCRFNRHGDCENAQAECPAVFKVSCEFYVRAFNSKDVENYLKEVAGVDFAEGHLVVEESDDRDMEDINLT